MIQRIKCQFGLHHWNKFIPAFIQFRRVEVRSCIHCAKLDARFDDELPAAREVRA